jgi:hypothetical protein
LTVSYYDVIKGCELIGVLSLAFDEILFSEKNRLYEMHRIVREVQGFSVNNLQIGISQIGFLLRDCENLTLFYVFVLFHGFFSYFLLSLS